MERLHVEGYALSVKYFDSNGGSEFSGMAWELQRAFPPPEPSAIPVTCLDSADGLR